MLALPTEAGYTKRNTYLNYDFPPKADPPRAENHYFYFMARRKLSEKNLRKIIKSGSSHAITIPIEILRELKWRQKQKVVVKKRGKGIIITDWSALTRPASRQGGRDRKK